MVVVQYFTITHFISILTFQSEQVWFYRGEKKREEKCEREAVTVIVIYKPERHSSQSIFEFAVAAAAMLC